MKRYLQDKKKSIVLFLALFIMYSLIYMTKNCYSAAMASIVDAGIMTKTETGMIAAIFYLVYAPFQIVGGIAADKFSPAKLLLIGTAGAGVCNLLVYFFSDNYIAMLIIWSLNAVIQFGIWPSVFKIIVSQLAPEHRTRGVYFIHFAQTVGLTVSYLCGAVINDWRNNFLLSAIVLFLLVVVFTAIYVPISHNMVIDESASASAEKKTKKSLATSKLMLLVMSSGIPLLLIAYIVQGIMNIGLKALVPVMLLESYESVTPEMANILNAVLIVLSPLGMLLGAIPVFKRFSYPTVISILFAVCVPLALVLTFVGDANMFIIMAALFIIICAMGAMSAYFSYCSKTFEKYGISATLSGTFNCMSSLALFFANYVFMGIAEQHGWGVTTKIWLVIAIIALALAIVSIFLWKRFMKKTESIS